MGNIEAKNVIVGLGNTGTQIIKLAAKSPKLKDCILYAIDSVMTNVDLDTVKDFKYIPIISDEKTGSGRSRERGMAMYRFHEEQGKFDEMYEEIKNSKQPVIVISSSAGGTGSGSIIPFCERLVKNNIKVIPIIVCPSLEDPIAYHLNTNDLMVELDAIANVDEDGNEINNVKTYSVFRNINGVSNYETINSEIVQSIEVILGKHYEFKNKDSIDDSDLDTVLSTPGRFISIIETTNTLEELKRNIIKRIFSGYQPAWSDTPNIIVRAFGLKSMFASSEYHEAFSEVNARIDKTNEFDEFRNIVDDNNDGKYTATVIVAGLPQIQLRVIDTEFNIDKGLAPGMTKSNRPSFISKKKSTFTPNKGLKNINSVDWK